MTDAKTITAAEFSLALHKCGVGAAQQKRIAVAVSGGGDSVALALLVNERAKECGGEMLALTVDHKLRADSTAEALAVQKIFHDRGIAHEILTWEGAKPATHIQERAREARYRLLLAACRAHGFDTLAVAHNLEDQLETFWMRLAHGSGLDGLAGMAAVREMKAPAFFTSPLGEGGAHATAWEGEGTLSKLQSALGTEYPHLPACGGPLPLPKERRNSVTIIRPLLSFPRARLRAVCAGRGAAWVEDPSNMNDKYLRVKLRAFEEALAAEGLTPARLALTLQKLEDAKEALQEMAAAAFASCVQLYPEGYAALDVAVWQKSPRDIQRRVLVQALGAVSPQEYPVGFEALEAARMELLDADFAGRTLAGCEIFPSRGFILIAREAAAVEEPVAAAEGKVWDKRFVISGITNAGLKIGALGGKTVEAETTLPFKIRRVLPALWQDGKLRAVPHLGYYSEDCPEVLKQGRITFCGKND
jgi:tRNA(Ile)-lysidine synthase